MWVAPLKGGSKKSGPHNHDIIYNQDRRQTPADFLALELRSRVRENQSDWVGPEVGGRVFPLAGFLATRGVRKVPRLQKDWLFVDCVAGGLSESSVIDPD